MRADGTRLKNTDPMYTVAAYIMDKRMDSMNMVTIDIPLDPVQDYLNKKRKEGIVLNHMDVMISAYIRTLAEYPLLNRFIANRKPYARNEIAVAMVVLKSGKMDNGTMSKMYFQPDYTIFQVHDTIEKYVNDNRDTPENNGTEKIIKFLLSMPGILPLGVGLFKFMDKHGLLPKAIIDMSPFHNTVVVSNLASIRTNHIYHHIYEFGTTSQIITMGVPREVPKRRGDAIVHEHCMPLGVVMDERICSGSYYAMAFRKMRALMKNPELMEIPPEKIVPDPNLPVKKVKK